MVDVYKIGSAYDGAGDEIIATAIPFGGGVFITAAHAFDEYIKNPDGTTAEHNAEGYPSYVYTGNDAHLISDVEIAKNFSADALKPGTFNASTLVNDFAAFVSPSAVGSVPTYSLTPIIAFADQDAASHYFQKNSGVGFTGLHTTASGNETGVAQDQFTLTLAPSVVDGDSGGAVSSVYKGTTYVVGTLSASLGQTAIASYINSNRYSALGSLMNGDLSGLQTLPPDIVMGQDNNEYIRGSYRKANIITNGDNDVILAGSGGGLINTGTGKNDVVFLPSANGETDPGTTIVVSPGTTTLVGGGRNDKLVLLADRLSTVSGSTPTLSDTSNTVQLLGGYGHGPYTPGVAWDAYSFSTTREVNQPTSGFWADGSQSWIAEPGGNNGEYVYSITYEEKGADLLVIVEAPDATAGGAGSGKGWNGSVTIKNFHNGDFGINLQANPVVYNDPPATPPNQAELDAYSNAEMAITATPQSSFSVNDDAAVTWDGISRYTDSLAIYGYQGPTFSDTQISTDLASVLANTQGGLTSLVEPPPPANNFIALAPGAAMTVNNPNQTVNASGAGSTINFGGTGETASISAGTVDLSNAASATITGNTDAVVLNGNGTVSISGTGNILHVNGTGNKATTASATVSFSDHAGATLTGSGNTVGLGSDDTLTLLGSNTIMTATGTGDTVTVTGTGTGNSVNLQGTGSSVTMSGGSVQMAASIAATLSGSNDYIYVDTSGTLTLTGGGNTINAHGVNDTITATGAGNIIGIGATGDRVTMSSGTLSFSDHAGATLTGSGNTIGLGGGDTLSLSGSNTIMTATGTGDTVTVTGAGTGNSISLLGTGSSVTLSGGSVQLAPGIAATLSGSNDYVYADAGGTLTLAGNTNTINAHGSGDAITILGASSGVGSTGDQVTMSSGTLALSANSSAYVTGNSDRFSFGDHATLTTSGTNETFIFAATPVNATLGGLDASDVMQFSTSTFANWNALFSHASQDGNNVSIHTDQTHIVTLANVALANIQQSNFRFA